MASARNVKDFNNGVFSNITSFKGYGVIYIPW